MRVVGAGEILAALDPDAAMAAIEDGFRRLSAGDVQVGAVSHLAFADPPGDCHVKAAAKAGEDIFVVKLATGFYRNPALGLSPSNGFMAVISARTGAVLALLHDKGQLTDLRTAMAGAIAAKLIARPGSRTLGVVGAGVQGGLQARHIARALGLTRVLTWGRSKAPAHALADALTAEGLAAETAPSVSAVCAAADLIVTTTPSTTPLIGVGMVRPGARIVAVGADAPGKRELNPGILRRARRIVVDSRAQCVDHGEAGWAVRAGLVRAEDLIELGDALTDPTLIAMDDTDIAVADLTGVAVQDLQIAKSVWERLPEP